MLRAVGVEIDLLRRLYIARRRIEKRINHNRDFYICSFSNQTIVYKGLYAEVAKVLFGFGGYTYADFDLLISSTFSTNTQPRWKLAQPFRYLAHNGEINTISGNRAWARSKGL